MNRRTESDEWLMGQVRRGNRDALEKLVRRYAGPLLTFIRRMVANRHQSEELFQDVFLAVWKKRRQYKLNHRFRSWLYAIAANRCRSEFRKLAPPLLGALELSQTQSAGDAPVQMAMATETASLIEEAIGLLTQQQKAVVVLRIWDDMPYSEIAEVTGGSESTVRSHMFRGLLAMRKFLEPRL